MSVAWPLGAPVFFMIEAACLWQLAGAGLALRVIRRRCLAVVKRRDFMMTRVVRPGTIFCADPV